VNLALHPLRGPAGRRAVIAAGLVGLLISSLSLVEGCDAQAPQPGQRGSTPRAGKLAQAVLSRPRSGSLTVGMRLLDQAAKAVRLTSYQGVQVISWLTPGGSGAWLGSGTAVVTVDVWHRTGLGTLTRVTATAPTAAGWSNLTDDPAGQPPDGVLGLTPPLLGLLRMNYAVIYTGQGSADGRPASIVEAVRQDGTLAARFWLDKVTKLPLRRELFDSHAHLISEDDFASLKLGPPPGKGASAVTNAPAAAFSPAITGARPAIGRRAALGIPAGDSPTAAFRPWADQLGPAQQATLRAEGWPVPGVMPGGLTLFEASESTTTTGRVVDFGYSDGLSVVSLFVQRGQLPATLAGWGHTDLSGNQFYVRNPGEPDLTWSAAGFVFTVVVGAPAPIVADVVNTLPHQTQSGFWSRMDRGARRLLSWANPFR